MRSAAAAIASAVRCASAMIVIIGFVPEEVGKALASPIQTPVVSCSSPQGPATLVCGSFPIRQVPIWWAENRRKPPAASGTRCQRAMAGSRSSPGRHDGAPAAIGWISRAPAATCRRACASIARVRVANVELVGERVEGDRLPVGVDVDAAVTAVAQQADEGHTEADLLHHLLVRARAGERQRRADQRRRVLGRLDQEAVAVLDVGELVDEPGCGAPHQASWSES